MSNSPGESIEFKKCPMCGEVWTSREELLSDKDVVLVGYQANFEDLELGLLFFNHSCGTTFVLNAGVFVDLYKGPIFAESLRGSDVCPGYCFKRKVLEKCPAQCECASIREILDIIEKYPKKK